MSDFDKKSYKELQMMAKRCSIPANMQRKYLIQALLACENNQPDLVKEIINYYKTYRKRRIANKPQNLSTCKRKRKTTNKSLTKNKDEIIVDSTSVDVARNTNGSSMYMESENSNTSTSDRYGYSNRLYNNQQPSAFTVATEFPHLNPSNVTSDHRSNGACIYDYQINFKNPCAASTPYNTPMLMSKYQYHHQDATQNYQYPDSPCSPYYNYQGMYRPTSYPQLTSYACDFNTENVNAGWINQNYSTPGYISSVRTDEISPGTKNAGTCSQPNTKSPSMEIDCPSHLLPNIPQLDTGSENVMLSNSNCASWSRSSVIYNEPERNNSSVSNVQHNGASYQFHEISTSQNTNPTTDDRTSVNGESDSNSGDTLSQCELDFYHGFLDWAKDGKQYLPPCYDSSAQVNSQVNPKCETPACFSINSNYNVEHEGPNTSTEALDGSAQSAKNLSFARNRNACQAISSLPKVDQFSFFNATTPTEQSSVLPLPAVRPLLPSSQEDCMSAASPAVDTLTSEEYSESQMGHENTGRILPTNNVMTAEDRSAYRVNYTTTASHINDQNCINLISPGMSPEQTTPERSILRGRLQQTEISCSASVSFSSGNRQVIDSYGDNSRNTTIAVGKPITETSFDKNSLSNETLEVMLKNAIQETQISVNVGNTKSVDSVGMVAQAGKDIKSEIGQLIYESETLHRSKIICSIGNDTAMKSGSVRKLIQSYLSKEKCPDLKPISSLINMSAVDSAKATVAIVCRPCKYKKKGCSIVAKVQLIHIHEKKCVFQPICCPADMCNWYDSMNALTRHISEFHKTELKNTSECVHVVERKMQNGRSFHTFFQVYNDVIYVIRLRIAEESCVAIVQYIPEIESMTCKMKRLNGTLQLISFCNRVKVKSWKGIVLPYYEENQEQLQEEDAVQVDTRDSRYIVLRFSVPVPVSPPLIA